MLKFLEECEEIHTTKEVSADPPEGAAILFGSPLFFDEVDDRFLPSMSSLAEGKVVLVNPAPTA